MTNPAGPSRLRFGLYELDARTGEVWREGALVHLPPQPFKVLWLLASRAGDVVTREEIRQELWGSDTFVDFDGGLNFCINQIRKALRDSAESPRFIHTLPRRGYRFIAAVEAVSGSAAPAAGLSTPAPSRTEATDPAVAVPSASESASADADGTVKPPRARMSHLYEVVPTGDGDGGRRWRAAGGGMVRLSASPIALEEPIAAEAERPLAERVPPHPQPAPPLPTPPPHVEEVPPPTPTVGTAAPVAAPARLWRWAALVLALVALGVAAWLLARRPPDPVYERVTFRRGTVSGARFGPGGEIAYSASWDGGPRQVHLTRPGETVSRTVPTPDRALVESALDSGELAVILTRETGNVLTLLPRGGGAPREVVDDVTGADVSRDGTRIAITRAGGEDRIELPPGKEIYRVPAKLAWIRLSPAGDRVAFFEHPVPGDDRGSVVTVDAAGRRTELSKGWASLEGLAWSGDGREVWFTGAKVGADSSLNAVRLSGAERVVIRGPGRLVLHDVRDDSAALLERTTRRVELRGRFPPDGAERDLSWLDLSFVTDISADGRHVVFSESGEGGGQGYAVFLRPTDGSPPVRLGEGRAMTLSPDGRWVLTIPLAGDPRVLAVPTGAGEPRVLGLGLTRHTWARWFPDSRRAVFTAAEAGQALRLYVQDIDGGRPRAIPSDLELAPWPALVAPDGQRVLVRTAGFKGEWHFQGVEGGAPVKAPLESLDRPLAFTPDGGALFVQPRWVAGPAFIDRIDLATGARGRWQEVAMADPAGVTHGLSLVVTPDGRSYAYTINRVLSELYLVRGLR